MARETSQKLSKQKDKFCRQYLKCENQSEAYRNTFDVSNMTSKSVNEAASRLMKDSKIAARINDLRKQNQEIAKKKFSIEAEDLLRQLNNYREANIADYVELVEREVFETDEDGRITSRIEKALEFKAFNKLTREQLDCIESVKNTRYGIELKLHGKEWSIEKIAKNIGFYEIDNEQKKSDTQPQININYNGAGLSLNTNKK